MSINGNLSTMALGDVLQWIAFGQKTGILDLQVLDCRKSVFVRSGRVVFASSTKSNERLGQFLVLGGKISPESLEHCLELHRQFQGREKLSELLVDQNLLTSEEMLTQLHELVQEIIYDLFLYEDGSFAFQEGPLPAHVTSSFELESQHLLFEGLRRFDEFCRNLKKMPLPEQVLLRAPELKPVDIEKNAELLYRQVDGSRDVEELLHVGPLSPYETQAHLMRLLDQGLVIPKPTEPQELTKRRANRLLQKGILRLQRGDLVKARDLFRQLGDLTTFDAEMHSFALQLSKAIFQDVEKRLGGLDRAIQVNPETHEGNQDEVLNADQVQVLGVIEKDSTLRSVLENSGFSKIHTYNVLFSLLEMEILSRVDTP